MRNGDYDTPTFRDDDGWAWCRRHRIHHPQHWQPRGDNWHVPSDTAEPFARRAVHGINWFEARAFARYAGARLVHETEWETACRAGILEGAQHVWEWCDNAFYPCPDFRAYPYDSYSNTWFDGYHRVTRSASRYTEPDVRRPGFRNFYPPSHRHIFAGLRLAWPAASSIA